jgi:rhamnose utilization protein RhaD (predicted bifunctional aldolase and dehydrogenase)/NAD(P)-dependent dehydrogenase (short-subunit alcohol dehydrogenase family)
MASSIPWPTFETSDQPIDVIVKLSRYYGSDPEFVLAGGGNTSAKVGDRLFVKGSGHSLATISPDGFVEMDRKALEALLHSELSTDKTTREQQFKDAVMAARIAPEKGQRPSVEALLHHLMPGQYVVHSHSTLVNMFTCCAKGQAIAKDALGDQFIWVPEVDPGFVLANELKKALQDRPKPRAILMQNHGLVISGDSADEIKRNTDWLVDELHKALNRAKSLTEFGAVSRIEDSAVRKRLINFIAPALRGLLASGENLKIVTFDDSQDVLNLVGGAEGKALATGGPLTPDQIVYCRSFPLWFEPAPDATGEQIVQQLRDAIAAHRSKTGSEPQIVLVMGLGLFAAADDFGGATTARDIYIDIVKVMAGAQRLGGVRYMDAGLRKFIEEWEVEAYRKQVSAASRSAGRVAGKVAIVTGAAQGFGLEISQDLASQGACVALTDINAEGTKKAANALNEKIGKTRAIGVAINVTDEQSVAEAIHQTVRTFGGFDLFVSNAGVLKAGSVKTQPRKDFDFVTAVNYTGYFVCVQAAAPILATQHAAKNEYWSDIIQINSKSGLQGSNKNGAYAGSKFGGIGLTQSFAMELVEDGVKVNSICPGNFFDGPLWSDPDNGLFAQYLRTGKVPGAKTIGDVKKFYESKVPMNRGCTTPDVMKAIYYLIEQKYETGQAVPVTGGQVMLK